MNSPSNTRNPDSTNPELHKSKNLFFGWVVLTTCVVICTISYTIQYSFGVFFKPLQQEFNWSRALTSGAFSLFLFSHGAFGLLTGWAADRFGVRKVIATAGLCMGLGLFMSSKATAVWHLYVFYGLMLGFGIAGIWTPMNALITRWFTYRRGVALGILAAGVGLGAMLSGPISGMLIDTYGWRISYMTMGIAAWVLVIGGSYFVVARPEQRGLAPYQKNNLEVTSKQHIGATLISTQGKSLKQAMKTRYLWVLFGMQVLMVFSLQIIMAHIVNHATDVGISNAVARILLTLIGGLSVVGKLSSGYFSEIIGARRVFFISAFGKGLILILLIESASPWMFYVCAIFFGLFYGGWVPMFPALVSELFGTKHMGTIYGSVIMMIGIGGPLGPWLAGYLFDHTQTYTLAFALASAASFGAAALVLLLRKRNVQEEISTI